MDDKNEKSKIKPRGSCVHWFKSLLTIVFNIFKSTFFICCCVSFLFWLIFWFSCRGYPYAILAQRWNPEKTSAPFSEPICVVNEKQEEQKEDLIINEQADSTTQKSDSEIMGDKKLSEKEVVEERLYIIRLVGATNNLALVHSECRECWLGFNKLEQKTQQLEDLVLSRDWGAFFSRKFKSHNLFYSMFKLFFNNIKTKRHDMQFFFLRHDQIWNCINEYNNKPKNFTWEIQHSNFLLDNIMNRIDNFYKSWLEFGVTKQLRNMEIGYSILEKRYQTIYNCTKNDIF